MRTEHILLQIPADDRYAAVARLTGAQLASQVGFDVDRVEDVRIAVSEAVRILTAGGGGAPVTADFEVTDDGFSARLSRVATVAEPDDASARILRATTDRHRVEVCAGSPATVVVEFAGSPEPGLTMQRER